MVTNEVGSNQFAILQSQIVGNDKEQQLNESQTIVRFSRVGQSNVRMVVSILFSPEIVGSYTFPQHDMNSYSVVDFDDDLYLSGAPLTMSTRIDNDDNMVINFSTNDMTVKAMKGKFDE